MKIAVVTGGLGGIGFGIAKALTENGYTVFKERKVLTNCSKKSQTGGSSHLS